MSEEMLPNWLKNLSPEDFAAGYDKSAAAPEPQVLASAVDGHNWLQTDLAEAPPAVPATPQEAAVPAAPNEAPAPAAEEKTAEKIATIPLQLSEADQSAVAQQLKDRGRGIMDRIAARAAEITNLAERQKSMLKLQEAKEAVDKAKEVLPAPLPPEQALKLTSKERNLQRYADKMSPVTDSAVEARAARRRGGMTESAIVEKELDVEDLQAEVACKQMVIEDLGISGQEGAARGLSAQYDAVNQEVGATAQRSSLALDKVNLAQAALKAKEAELKRKKLTPEDKEAILEKKKTDLAVAKKEMADLVVEEKEAGLRQAEIKAKLDAANAVLSANRITEAQIKGLINQRQDAINLATTEIAVAGKVSNKTRAELASARENCEQLARSSRQEIAVNTIAGNIAEVDSFVKRLTEVRVLPGGLQNQLGMIDTEINYLQQPGAVEGGLDPALEMAIERNVRSLGGGDIGREAYLKTLFRDRSTVLSLIDIDNDPYSLIQNPSTPAILRQALTETQAEEARRSANRASGSEGQGAHGGFLEVNSEDQTVRNLAEIQRGTVTKVLESFGLTPPLTAEEQQHWQQVGGDLRGMEISGKASDSWRDVISRAEMRQKAAADLASVEANLKAAQAEAEARAAELQNQIEEQKLRATAAEAQVASTTNVLDQARQQVADLTPLAKETLAAREAEEAKAEELAGATQKFNEAISSAVPAEITSAAAEFVAAGGEPGVAADEIQSFLHQKVENVSEDVRQELEKHFNDFMVGKITKEELKIKTRNAKVKLGIGGRMATADEKLAGALSSIENVIGSGPDERNEKKDKMNPAQANITKFRAAEIAQVSGEGGLGSIALLDPLVNTALKSMGLL
ncbi:hypothetical protein HZB78_02995 [Candidatus Collierbacteria bacterium]|nr:hypothetical protein [Candidatus Collierbacteria bacterium]